MKCIRNSDNSEVKAGDVLVSVNGGVRWRFISVDERRPVIHVSWCETHDDSAAERCGQAECDAWDHAFGPRTFDCRIVAEPARFVAAGRHVADTNDLATASGEVGRLLWEMRTWDALEAAAPQLVAGACRRSRGLYGLAAALGSVWLGARRRELHDLRNALQARAEAKK